MRVACQASRPGHLVCPACEAGRLRPSGGFARCGRCEYVLDAVMLLPLERIVALPNASGRHACECGHPEMRLLPDGVYHCPACGSEVLPSKPHRSATDVVPDRSRGRPEERAA
jgi:ribosomal protein L37AE/L43A